LYKACTELGIGKRTLIMKMMNSEEFTSKTPCEIVPILADRGIYLGSERTFYKVLSEAKMLVPKGHKWDITYLNGPIKGKYFYLYMFLPFALVTQAVYCKTKISQELVENKPSIIFSASAISAFFSGFILFFAVRLLQNNVEIVNWAKRINIYSFLSALAGVTFIIMAYAVSKSGFNSSFGIKTVWSSTNKDCWSKTQNSCKVLFVFSGLLMILQAAIWNGFTCLALLIIEMLIVAILCVLFSYFTWRRCKIM